MGKPFHIIKSTESINNHTIGATGEAMNVDDIVEAANHFKCIDMIITQANYALTEKFIKELLDFHVRFESIHPFQDGNGRVGRLILFKECLRNNIVPFIIDDEMKMFYYRGLHEWNREKGYLTNTCLAAQDKFRKYLDYFRIGY